MQNAIWRTLARVRRGKQLLGVTRFIVLSNFLRTGLVGFLSERPGLSASLDEIVEFYFAAGMPPAQEDIDLLLEYYRGTETPTKHGFVQFLVERAGWLAAKRGEVKLDPPEAGRDWRPWINELHARHDPRFAGHDPAKRLMARAHWHNFLAMADAFELLRYAGERAQLSERAVAKYRREMALFADGYYGVDDLLGVLLKVEGLRAETDFIVTPPPFMLETCDALAERLGIGAFYRHCPELGRGGCRVLDLACGSGIYSNAFAERGNECIAVDSTPWVFYRAFLAAQERVRVECCDMNALPERVTREPFTHVVCNIAAHHLQNRPALFAAWRGVLRPGGQAGMLNFDYSLPNGARSGMVARLKRQFAAQIRYNWTVLDYARGNVQFISPRDVARDLEAAGYEARVHACDALGELFLVRGMMK